MYLIKRESVLWNYLSEEIQDLIKDGEMIVEESGNFKHKISDFSYLVFPFSKAYEGYLKRLFLDLNLLREDDYYGEDVRIGRILNPGYIHELSSVYKKICLDTKSKQGGNEVSKVLWDAWKRGRNQVFHYFPHNFRKLSYDEALDVITQLLSAMDLAVSQCKFSIK
jgi:hypothetical protein